MSDAETKKDETAADHSPDEAVETAAAAETPVDENGPVNVGHQDNDLDLKTVKKFIISSLAVTLGAFIVMLIVLKFFKSGFEAERGVATAETRQIPSKDDAILQTQPLMDLAEYNALEESRMNTTTDAGEHAVIPVAAAKQLMLQENAFPTPTKAKETHSESQVASVSEPVAEVAVMASAVAPVAPTAPAVSAAPTAAAVSAAPAVPPPAMVMVEESAPLDPQMVAAGKIIWETQCMVCHTGKKGAIGPNIQKAFGSMRQLENHEPILMDTAYVINSMNNPMEHVAKGYSPVMMSFKESLTQEKKEQVAAYLQSQGKPIMKAVPAPTAVPTPAAVPAPAPTAVPASAPTVEPTAAPAPIAPAPTAVPPPAIEQPAPPAAPAAPADPEAPAPGKPDVPPGVIFV